MDKIKIGFYGSCQLSVAPFFFSKLDNYDIKFVEMFFLHAPEYVNNCKKLNYNIFNSIDILIIENNKLTNESGSDSIIAHCKKLNIRIICTCLLKFPIFPLNWSGRGENWPDYKIFKFDDDTDYRLKFEQCINSLKKEILQSDLSTEIVDYINDNFKYKRLFTHSLHPSNDLLYVLYKNIFALLDIDITNFDYVFDKELIMCWNNPFTSKMITDLGIEFDADVNDSFYIERYKKNIKNMPSHL